MDKNTRRIAAGALIGGIAGYVAGVLTAPKSGKETRQDIQKAASKAKTLGERKLKELHSELNGLIEQSKGRARGMTARAKKEYTKVLSGAKEARQKARELLSALHDGDADNKDLQKAIKEVTKATKHLKNYLKKHDRKETRQ